MAQRRPEKQLVFRVEEKHRGKWQQLIGDDDKPRKVVTTEAFAKAQNVDANTTGIRYVADGEVKEKAASDETDADLESLKEEYKDKAGRPPHHTWDADKIREKLSEL